MDSWHQYTLRGNTEYQLALYGNAILLHNQALDFARHNFPNHLKVCINHAIARVLISHFSLADCYCALTEVERSAECYLEAQRFLLRCSEELPPSGMALHALQHANSHLHALWCELLRNHKEAVPYASQLDYHHNSQLLMQEALNVEVLH